MFRIIKFINAYGLAAIIILAVIVTVFTIGIFYFYTFSAINSNDTLGQDELSFTKEALEQVAVDLSGRQANLERLIESPLELRDVFK